MPFSPCATSHPRLPISSVSRGRPWAQIAIERALQINASCASLYEEEFKWSLLDPFVTAKGAQESEAVCELAMHIQSTEKPGMACSETTSAVIRAHGEASARGPDLRRLIDKLGSTLRSRFAFSNAPRARDNEKGADYWANRYFHHLPKDRLLLGVFRRGDSFKVTTFIWQPDE